MPEIIKSILHASFDEISNEFNAEGVKVLMPTCAPNQGRLLAEFSRAGGDAYISGGKKGMPAFPNVNQYGLDFDTAAYINVFPEGICEKIVGAIPDDLLDGKKIALFAYIPPARSWVEYINDRGFNHEIVASNEQNTRLFFERKGNLMHILEQAGLGEYVIPTAVIDKSAPEREIRNTYNMIKNDNGKVVVQACVENYEQTVFIDNEEDFVAKVSSSDYKLKVAKFIEGSEANLSFFVCNTVVPETGRGVLKTNLPEGIDLDDPASLEKIEENAFEHGIDSSNVFSVTGRATLKVVGDPLLANERGCGVGNNIGHVYDENIGCQITEVGDKLGQKMALCGKVGLAGADLIIEKNGKVWVNEINDRQQGPTDQMSFDAEKAGLPGLSRMAWFAHFADFSNEKNLNLLAAIRDKSDAIHQKYMKSRASFYIKMVATHDAKFNGTVVAKRDLKEGVYIVKKRGCDWEWEKSPRNGMQEQPVDLASGAIAVRIDAGSLKAGDKVLADTEMFRITGIADGENSPFILENGFSRLSPKWVPIIEQIYKGCLGEDYLEKNPLRRPDAPKAKNEAPAQLCR